VAVKLDPQLLEIVACPCPEHAPLRVGTPADPLADYLSCTACARAFPVRDGIPVLLLEDAEHVAEDGTVSPDTAAAASPDAAAQTGVTSRAGTAVQPGARAEADKATEGTVRPDRNSADG
jgi:uncharacterized protein YbaR (Trm112 family)